jgi:hypothetical protein
MGDLDIVPVPEELKIASDNPPQKVTVTWKSELDQKNPGPDTIVRMLVERHRFHISISMSLAFSIYIVFLFFSKISVQLAAGSEKYTSIPTFVLKHR